MHSYSILILIELYYRRTIPINSGICRDNIRKPEVCQETAQFCFGTFQSDIGFEFPQSWQFGDYGLLCIQITRVYVTQQIIFTLFRPLTDDPIREQSEISPPLEK